jgi:hypothetical protein
VGVTQQQRHRIELGYVLNKLAKRNRGSVSIRSDMVADEFGIHRGETYVPSIRRRHSSNGRRSQFHRRNSGGVHRQMQKIFQSEWSESVSKNEGEMKWQRATRKRISQ